MFRGNPADLISQKTLRRRIKKHRRTKPIAPERAELRPQGGKVSLEPVIFISIDYGITDHQPRSRILLDETSAPAVEYMAPGQQKQELLKKQ